MLHYFAGRRKDRGGARLEQLAVGFYDFARHGHRQLSKWAKTHKNVEPFLWTEAPALILLPLAALLSGNLQLIATN